MHDDAVMFLRSLRDARIERKEKEMQLQRLYAEAERVTSMMSFAGGGGGDKRKDALLVEIADRSRDVEDAIAECLRREMLVEELVASITDIRLRTVLRLRYIDCIRWEKLRDKMDGMGLPYEMRSIYKLHGAALQAVREQYPDFRKKHPEIT